MDNKLKITAFAGIILFASGTALAGAESNPLKPLLGERDTSIVLGDAPKGETGSIFFTKDVPKGDPSVLGSGNGDNITFDSDLPQYLLEHRHRHEEELAGPRCSDNVRPGTVIYTNPPIYNCDDLAEQDEQLRNTIREMVIEILEELREQGNFQDLLKGEEKLN